MKLNEIESLIDDKLKNECLKILTKNKISEKYKTKLLSLTNNDFFDIGCFYSKRFNEYNLYIKEYRKTKNPNLAFNLTFKAYYNKIIKNRFNNIALTYNSEITKSILKFYTPIIPEIIQTKKIIKNFMPPYLEIIDSSLNLAKSLSIWTDALQLKMQTPFADLFKSAQLFSNTYLDHINNIQKSLKSVLIPNIVESFKVINQQSLVFIDLSKTISKIIENKISLEIDDLLEVNSYLIRSDSFITTTNNYFSTKETIDKSILIHKENEQKIITDLNNANVLLNQESNSVLINTTTLISTIRNIKEEIKDDLQKKYGRVFDWFDSILNPTTFLNKLKDFASFIQKNHWDSFWVDNGEKYKPKPESIGKALLGLFLEGFYKGKAFIGNEIKSGIGFIDILVNILGIEYIVELKMLGCSYGISYARKGTNQLFNYMNTYNINEGYLIIFDGRKTNKGEILHDIYESENKKIYTISIKII